MQSAGLLLLNNGDTTGAAQEWPGGVGQFTVWADFDGSGGGSVALEWLASDGVTWIPANDADGNPVELDANGAIEFTLPRIQVRAVAVTVTPTIARADRITR